MRCGKGLNGVFRVAQQIHCGVCVSSSSNGKGKANCHSGDDRGREEKKEETEDKERRVFLLSKVAGE